MEFSEILAQLRRRWWLALIGLVATGGLAFGASVLVAVQYTAQASLVLIPPRTTADTQINPFLAIGGLNPAADVLVRALNSGTFHDQHAPAGGTAKYTVARDTDASGPLLVVDVSDATPEAATKLLDAVVQQAPVSLSALQHDVGVEDSVAIRITEVARTAEPKVDRKSQIRALLAAVVVGLAGTVLIVRIADAVLVRRAGRPRRSTPEAVPPSTEIPAPMPGADDATSPTPHGETVSRR